MLKFVLYAVIAYFVYQLVVAIDWGHATSSVTSKAENTAGSAYHDVADSGVVQTIGDAFGAIKKLIIP